ncbi:outer membrane protein [Legionella dresdenensis]|uniref:Outer membrane protein n=1 Tax=Legionella dresdenensis TaxID=450200 RepID=A0ABV8CEQ5_9GAMM
MRTRTKVLKQAFTATMLLPLTAYANSAGYFTDWLLSGSFGIYQYESGTKNLQYVVTELETDRMIQRTSRHAPMFGVALKKPVYQNTYLQGLSIGPALYYQRANFTGAVLQYDDWLFNNYNYNMGGNVYNGFIEAEALLKPFYKAISPVVVLGVGASYARLDYHDYPAYSDVAEEGRMKTSGHSNAKFAFEAGAGIAFPLLSNLKGRLNYLYQNTGRTTTQIYNATGIANVSISNRMDSHNLLFSVVYQIGS